MTTAIAKTEPKGGLTPTQIDTLKYLNLNPTDIRTQAVIVICERYGFDPILKHVIVIPNGGVYVTRDGLLNLAHRSGQFDGMDVKSIGESDTHYIAEAIVWRKDMSRPFRFSGRFPKSKKTEFGPEMAEKVAVCRALRHAFDVSVCSREETWEEDDFESEITPQRQPTPKATAAPTKPNDPKLIEARTAACKEMDAQGISYRDSDKKIIPGEVISTCKALGVPLRSPALATPEEWWDLHAALRRAAEEAAGDVVEGEVVEPTESLL